MISFASDYIAGCHPKVLQKLIDTNLEVLPGYGTDKYCLNAKEKIKQVFNCPNGDVYFLVGGTQTNQVVIDTMLDASEGVISCDTGHINVHEAGAIEFAGHKVLPITNVNGKLTAKSVKEYIDSFYKDESRSHIVVPGMVYISFPTEYGTLYSKEEMTNLHNVCKEYNIPLFVDGARLGYGLASKDNDIKIEEFASLCDAFYIGGTKVGALCGEAVVFTNSNTPRHMVNKIKQHGALLAKGRLLGIQFDTLFTDNLYMEISNYALKMADKLKSLFINKGYKLFIDSPTNQQFVILSNKVIEELKNEVVFETWGKYDDENAIVRFVVSWSTTEEDINKLATLLK